MIVHDSIRDLYLPAAAINWRVRTNQVFVERGRVCDRLKDRARLERGLDRPIAPLDLRRSRNLVWIESWIVGKRQYLAGSGSQHYDGSASRVSRFDGLGQSLLDVILDHQIVGGRRVKRCHRDRAGQFVTIAIGDEATHRIKINRSLLLMGGPRQQPVMLLNLQPQELRPDRHHPKDDRNLNDGKVSV